MFRHYVPRVGVCFVTAVLAFSAGTLAWAADGSKPAGQSNEKKATEITLFVPTNAEVWFDSTKTTQTGATRRYLSPALAVGRNYTYHIRIRWNEDGNTVERIRHLSFRAGDNITLDYANGTNTVSIQGSDRSDSSSNGNATSPAVSTPTSTPTIQDVPVYNYYAVPANYYVPSASQYGPSSWSSPSGGGSSSRRMSEEESIHGGPPGSRQGVGGG